MDTKHTPTPWILDQDWILDGQHNPIVYASDDAAFIVRAVNSHDQLVAALKDCLAFLENDCPLDAPCGPEIRAARAALAAAEV